MSQLSELCVTAGKLRLTSANPTDSPSANLSGSWRWRRALSAHDGPRTKLLRAEAHSDEHCPDLPRGR